MAEKLRVIVHSAAAIRDTEVFGTQDPYVLVKLNGGTVKGGDATEATARSQRAPSGGVSPSWARTSTPCGQSFANTNLRSLRVTLSRRARE